MFGGGTNSSMHFRGDSTQASSLHNQAHHHNLLTSTQPAIAKENINDNRPDVNDSNFFYNSDEDREVDEILQQSNRLMERRNEGSIADDEERMRELQRQKLELLSLQHPNQDSSTYHNDSHLNDQSAVNIGEISRLQGQKSSEFSHPSQQTNASIRTATQMIPSEIFPSSEVQQFNLTDQGTKDDYMGQSNQTTSLNETGDGYPLGRVRSIGLTGETNESRHEPRPQVHLNAYQIGRLNRNEQDEVAQAQAMTQSSTHTIQPLPNGHHSGGNQTVPAQLQHLNVEHANHLPLASGRESEATNAHSSSLLMFNRERPLLEKVKSMRLEQIHLENKLKYMAEENEQLKKQLKLYQTSNEEMGDTRLKKHIQLLQDEVKYLTQINEQQEEVLRSQAPPVKKKANRTSSKSATRGRKKSQLRADIERSRSGMLRDCCVKKQIAVESETIDQFKRIQDQQRKYSPMQKSARLSHNNSSTFASANNYRPGGWGQESEPQFSMRSTYSKVSNKDARGSSALRNKSRSRTPTKVTPRLRQQYPHHLSQTHFEPLPPHDHHFH